MKIVNFDENVFFQNQGNHSHSFAPKFPTATTKHELETTAFWHILLLFNFNQGFVATLRCESCVQADFILNILVADATLLDFICFWFHTMV
jgi:hypothetical protein